MPASGHGEIISHLDWLPMLVAAAGDAQVKEKLLKGYKANGKKYKVHLDDYNFLPYLTGQEKEGPRKEFFYFSDGGDLMALPSLLYGVRPGPFFNFWIIEFNLSRMAVSPLPTLVALFEACVTLCNWLTR